ncbi:hypothetical protein HW555_001260, partial [Spodoptera exigua]
MLLPLNLLLYFMFCPKYCIKNYFIRPNSVTMKCVSFIASLIFMVTYTYTFYLFNQDKYVPRVRHLIEFVVFLHNSFCCVGFALNFMFVITSNKESIKFVVMFQKVHRILNSKTDSKRIAINNWIVVILTLTSYPIYYIVFSHFVPLSMYFIIGCLCISFIDFNVVYAIQIIKMLSNKVKLWNIRVELFEELEGKHGVNYWKKLFQIYVDLMECYKMHNFCYQAPIVYYLIDVSIHSLVYIQAVISMVQDGFENTSALKVMIQKCSSCFDFLNTVDKDVQSLLLPLNTLLYVIFCPKYRIKNDFIRPNNFNIVYAIQIIKMLTNKVKLWNIQVKYCVELEGKHREYCWKKLLFWCTDAAKILCKNVLRLHRASFGKMSLYAMFQVDAELQLGLLMFLTEYTILLKNKVELWDAQVKNLAFDSNVIYATQVMKLLTNKVELWNEQVKCGEELESRYRGEYYDKLFQTYVNILKCYEIHNNCYRAFIMFYAVAVLNHSLVYIQDALMAINEGIESIEEAA